MGDMDGHWLLVHGCCIQCLCGCDIAVAHLQLAGLRIAFSDSIHRHLSCGHLQKGSEYCYADKLLILWWFPLQSAMVLDRACEEDVTVCRTSLHEVLKIYAGMGANHSYIAVVTPVLCRRGDSW